MIHYFYLKFISSGLSDDEGESKPTSPQSSTSTNNNKQNKKPAGRESATTQFGEDIIPNQKATSALHNLLNGSSGTSSPKKEPTMLEKMMAGGRGSAIGKDKRREEKGKYQFNERQILY